MCYTLSIAMTDRIENIDMAPPDTSKKRLLDEACEMIAEMGGAGALIDDLAEFQKLRELMSQRRSLLTERYPDMWVGMGTSGLLAVGNSEEEVIRAIEEQGIRRADIVVEYLDTNPPALIL